MPGADIGAQLLKGQRRQTLFMVIFFVALMLLGGYVWRQESRTHDALCTLQGDLVQRAAAGNDFLAKHPHGAFGLTAAQIRLNITGQERTVKALDALHCKSPA